MTPPDSPSSLRLRRRAARIKLVDMAEFMSISAPYLYDLEHGNRRFSPVHQDIYLVGLVALHPKPTAGVSTTR